jgi:hypothetical protein
MTRSTHPLGTVAALKRALVPGTTIRLVNHVRPQASRTCAVHEKTNTVDLVTTAPDAPRGSHLSWPKAADLRPGDNDREVHIDNQGQPFLTITILEAT